MHIKYLVPQISVLAQFDDLIKSFTVVATETSLPYRFSRSMQYLTLFKGCNPTYMVAYERNGLSKSVYFLAPSNTGYMEQVKEEVLSLEIHDNPYPTFLYIKRFILLKFLLKDLNDE